MNRLFINKQRIILLAVFIPFLIFTDIALFSINSVSELWTAFTSHLMVGQVTIDFLICFTIVSLWVWKDAKSKNVKPVPYMILLWCTGSLGLLIYMFLHVYNEPKEASSDLTVQSATQTI